MSKGWMYKPGQWNFYCDVCSKKLKSGEAFHRWDGFIVCKEDYEIRHPMDFIKTRQEKISVPWTRSRNDNVIVSLYVLVDYVDTDYIEDTA